LLKVNTTVWDFQNRVLTITYYDYQLKTNKLVATYKYETNADKGLLKIIYNDDKTLNYKVGIASTGNYVLLMRVKE
jgi:hypothetical protein